MRNFTRPFKCADFRKVFHFNRHHMRDLRAKVQKQFSRGDLRKRCSENVQQTYRKQPCRSVISIKLQSNFIETPFDMSVLL